MLIVLDSKNSMAAPAFSLLGTVRLLDTGAITSAALRDADVVVVRSETRVGRALLDGTRVCFVGTTTIGTDHVDLEYLSARGIGFAGAPGSNANSVAEYITAALLSLGERKGLELERLSLGVVGVGHIGSRVARIGRALGMQVLLNDPPLARRTGDPRFVSLDDLMCCDILTLHVPLTRDGEDPTWHLFGVERISRMKAGSVLINSSRGAVVDTETLLHALGGRHLGGAVLDVWEHEPSIEGRLLEAVDIGTAHIAGYSLDGKVNAARMIFDAVNEAFALRAAWRPPEDLPPAAVAELHLGEAGISVRSAVHGAVDRCYSILHDDAALRKLLALPVERRADHFRQIRSQYPVRREFFNTRIVLDRPDATLETLLRSLGFETVAFPR